MADSRIQNLDLILEPELTSLLDTLTLALDNPSYSAGSVKKMLLKQLIQTAAIISGTSAYEHKIVSNKAFWNSLASETVRGIVELAGDEDINERSSNTVLTAGKIDELISNIRPDFFIKNQQPTTLFANTINLNISGGALSFVANWQGNTTQGQSIPLSPDLGGARFISISVQYSGAYANGTVFFGGFKTFPNIYNTGTEIQLDLGSTYGSLYCSSDRKTMGFKPGITATDTRVSINVTATCLNT